LVEEKSSFVLIVQGLIPLDLLYYLIGEVSAPT